MFYSSPNLPNTPKTPMTNLNYNKSTILIFDRGVKNTSKPQNTPKTLFNSSKNGPRNLFVCFLGGPKNTPNLPNTRKTPMTN